MNDEDIKLLLFPVTSLVTAEAGLIPSLNTKLRIILYIYLMRATISWSSILLQMQYSMMSTGCALIKKRRTYIRLRRDILRACYPHARYTSRTPHPHVFICYINIIWTELIWPTFKSEFYIFKKEKIVLKYPYSYLGQCQDLGHIDKWCHNCVSSISQYRSIQNPCGKRWCMLRRILTETSCSGRSQASRSHPPDNYLHTGTQNVTLTARFPCHLQVIYI